MLYLNDEEECLVPPRLSVPTELSILSEVRSEIYKNLNLYQRLLSDETLPMNDKFGMIPGYYMKRSLKSMDIKKSQYKYVCINLYKLKTLRLLADKFSDHFDLVYNKRLRLTHFLKHAAMGAVMTDDLSSKIDVLKRGLSINEVYAIMKYLKINCVIFDKKKTIKYTLSEFNDAVMVFRFNNSLDIDFCGSYDNIYKMIRLCT